MPRTNPHPIQRGDALAAIAPRESIRLDMERQRGVRVREALELGATWAEVATALNVAPDEARAPLRDWAAGQYGPFEGDVAAGRTVALGMDADRSTAGTYIEMTSRLLEPTLLALGALASRGRIER